MIISNHQEPKASKELLNFLRQKMGLTDEAIELGSRQAKIEKAPLTIILWNYGLLNLTQYQEVLDFEKEYLYDKNK